MATCTAVHAAGDPETTFYVAPDGSDTSGDGSAATPWATITAAVQKMPTAGGVLVVRDGLYSGNVWIARQFDSQLLIRAEHPYQARLRNDNFQTVTIYYATNVVISGFEISRGKYPTPEALCVKIAGSQSIALIGNIIHDSFNNDLIHINESPRNILILDNVFYNQQGGAGQHLDVNGATEVVIRGNIFFNDYSGGPYDGMDTHGYIVVKNSGGVPEARRTSIAGNVFLNWVGNAGSNFVLFGEDGLPFYESQDAVVENNLMIGNSSVRMRSPFSSKGAKNVVFRNNTITGDLPSSAYAVRFTRGGAGVMNQNFRFFNNVWSDPTGTMTNFADGFPEEAVGLILDRNLYWNDGRPIPMGVLPEKSAAQYTDDAQRIIADPRLPPPVDVLVPRWTGRSFLSGATSIREEFERLVRLYGIPEDVSPVIGAADPANAPRTDILDRVRGLRPDLGAVQVGALGRAVRVVLAPDSIWGGATSTLNQVVLSEPAGPGGTQVRLRSTDQNAVAAPSSVLVLPGMKHASFTLATTAVGDVTSVTILAVAGHEWGSAVLTLTPVGVSDVTLGLDTLTAGIDSAPHNLVYIDGVAGDDGMRVELSSSNPDLVSVPDSVIIAPGKSYSNYFTLAPRYVGTPTTVTITARLGLSQAGADLTLIPPKFRLALRSDVVSGEANFGPNHVILGAPAPAEGATIELRSTAPELLKPPASIAFAPGQLVAEFWAESGAAEKRTPIDITAQFGEQRSTARCDVAPLGPFRLQPSGPLPSGGSGNVVLTLSGAPARDTVVVLSVPDGSPVTIPPQVTVPAGNWSVSIPVSVAQVANSSTVRFTATYRTISLSTDLQVVAAQLKSLNLAKSAATGGLVIHTNTVTLTGVATGDGKLIHLESSAPSVVFVPDSLTIPAGASQVRFDVTPSVVREPVDVILTARCDGDTRTATQRVLPAALYYFYAQSPLAGGSTSNEYTVAFTGPAPPGGLLVQLTSSNPEVASVPDSVTLAEGQTGARFTVVSRPVPEPVDVILTAMGGGVSLSRTLTVRPPFVNVVTLWLTNVIGGDGPHTGRVYAAGTVPAEGLAVALTSSAPEALHVAPSVTIPGGAGSAPFTFTTMPVMVETSVTVTATGGGFSHSAIIVVKPS